MICLDSTTKKLVAYTQTAPSSALDVVAAFVDITSSAATLRSSDGTFDNTETDIVAAPAASTQRQVKNIVLFNRSTGEQNVTVSFKNGASERKLINVNLPANSALMYSNDGGWAIRSTLIETDQLIQLSATSDPAAPGAGTAYHYVKEVAGRLVPKFVGPSGLDTIMQNAIFGNGVVIAAPGSAAALSYLGMGALTAVGTVSHPALVSNNLRESTRRANVASAATANSASELRYAITQCWRGNGAGLGGFFVVMRFGFPSVVATQRVAVGLWASTAATGTSIEPSTLVSGVWVGNDAADANLQLMYNDAAGVATKINLGADFVKNQQNGIYELTLFCKPNDTKISYRVKRLDAAGEVSGELTSDIPTSTTFLAPHYYINNGGTAAAVQLDFYRYYLETDF